MIAASVLVGMVILIALGALIGMAVSVAVMGATARGAVRSRRPRGSAPTAAQARYRRQQASRRRVRFQ